MTVENLRLGLDAVIAAAPTLGIRIVNMSLAIPDDPEIRAKVAQLWDLGVVVVAPTGNRSTELPSDMPSTFEAHRVRRGRRAVHPPGRLRRRARRERHAGRLEQPGPDQLGDGELDDRRRRADRGRGVLLAPWGVVPRSTDPATSYAAAEVSGVLALLQSAYDEPIAASVRRLLTTANGRPDIPNTLVGAGEVQAMDALTRPMD